MDIVPKSWIDKEIWVRYDDESTTIIIPNTPDYIWLSNGRICETKELPKTVLKLIGEAWTKKLMK